MSTFKNMSIATILASMLVGCGGGGSSSSSSTNKATLIDDFVAGVKYVNGTNEGFTDSNGQFPYDSGSVEFYIGDIRLGTISSMPIDNKIFIQDLVGVSRTDTTNSEVIKIGRFLQSLDSDKSTDKIEISRTSFDQFEDANDTKTNLNDNTVVVDTLLSNAGIANKDIVSAAKAQSHIENILEFHGEKTTSVILSLTSSTINDGDTNINEDTDIELTFNDDIPRKYLTSDYFILTNDSTNARVNTTITRDQNVVTINPDADLDNSENYTLTIKSTIKSYAGTDINLGGNTDKTIAFVTQSAANLPPVANAGVDQIVTQGSNVTLDASSSSDSDGTISSYSWAEGSTVLSTNLSFNKSDFSVGTHTITLTVTDDDGATSSDDVTITVNAATNQAAVWNLANGTSSSAVENAAASYIIDLSGSTDSDGDTLSYEWFLSPTGSPGTIYNQSSGNISANTATTIDFTTADQRTNTPVALPAGTYDLRIVQYEDRGTGTPVSTSQTVTITISAASTGGNTGGSNPDAFIIKINTDLDTTNTNKSFYIDNRGTGDALNIDCDNDGTYEFIASTPQANYTCNYSTSGVYEIAITSSDPEVFFNFTTNTAGDINTTQITEIVNWGNIKWENMSAMFRNATNLSTINANAGNPDLSNVSSMYLMFEGATSFNADISSWDVSNVSDFTSMFSEATVFNSDISSWDVSNALSLAGMFNDARAFNQDIGGWDVSKVTNTANMFNDARAFNQDIGGWDVSSVTNMLSMFENAREFNQDLSSWNISNVTLMNKMFRLAREFNQDLSSWYSQKNTSLNTTDIFQFSGMSQANQDSFLVGPVSSAPLNAVITAQGISGTPFCSPSQRVGSEFISFTGSSSTGNIASYTWTDVTAGNNTNFINGGTTVSETYSCVGLPAGQRTIRLTITDSSGNTDTQDQTLNVVY